MRYLNVVEIYRYNFNILFTVYDVLFMYCNFKLQKRLIEYRSSLSQPDKSEHDHYHINNPY